MARRAVESVVGLLRSSPGVVTSTLGLVVLVLWAGGDGGFDPLRWIPGTLFLLAVVVVVAVFAPGAYGGGRWGALATVALAAYTAWSYLSITWAEVSADAWSGANKTFGYLCIFLLFTLRPVRPVVARYLLASYSVAIGAVGLGHLISISQSAEPARSFIEGRLAVPIDYSNANCALFVGAMFPVLCLASRRDVAAFARGVALASAGVLFELAVLCQSRASLAFVPLAVVVYLGLVSDRLRALLGIVVVAAVSAAAMPSLLHVYDTLLAGSGVHGAVVDARSAVFVSTALLLVLGVAWALVDRLVSVPARVTRWLSFAACAAAALVLLGGGALFLDRYGNPVDRTQIWWDRFKANDVVSEPGTPHFVSGFGSSRYEIWRVALLEFRAEPIKGIGADNFAVSYLRERRSRQEPLYPHSFELRVLEQTGLVGAALIVVFLAAALAGGIVARTSTGPAGRDVVAAAFALFAYWLAHGSIDWLWEIPALTGIAIGSVGLAAAIGPAGRRIVPRPAVIAGVCALAVFGTVALMPQWLAARETNAALANWRGDPDGAFHHLSRARSLNPLSDEPDVLAAVISAQLHDVTAQKRYLRQALERNPVNWYPYLELGAIAAREGQTQAAERWLAVARRLSPLDLTVDFVTERVRDGRPPTQAEVDDFLISRADVITGARQN